MVMTFSFERTIWHVLDIRDTGSPSPGSVLRAAPPSPCYAGRGFYPSRASSTARIDTRDHGAVRSRNATHDRAPCALSRFARPLLRSHQLQPQRAPDNAGGALQRRDGDVSVLGSSRRLTWLRLVFMRSASRLRDRFCAFI